ncbi:MAG: AmmeMemoRadiSam system protein B [Anaerolineales bacterium]
MIKFLAKIHLFVTYTLMNFLQTARPSALAGQWYPNDPKQLARSVDAHLWAARSTQIDGKILAVLAPHAGHTYSGAVAAHAFAPLKDTQPQTIVILSPMHYPYPYPLLTSLHRAYTTPLGEIPVARDLITQLHQTLQTTLGFGLTPIAQDPEHAIEIELPFLQRVFSHHFDILPLMLRDQSPQVARALAEALLPLIKDRAALVVASSDLSHFYTHETACSLDAELLRRVTALDPEGVLHAEEEGVGFACGRGAIAAALWVAQALGANRATLLKHATSGEITGDMQRVVGYAAAAITQTLN